MVIVHSCNVLQKSNKPDLCHTGSKSKGCWPPPLLTGLTSSLLWTPPSANTMPYSSCLQVKGTSYRVHIPVVSIHIRCIEFSIQTFWWIRVGGVRIKYWTIEHNFKIFDQKCNIQYVLSGLFIKNVQTSDFLGEKYGSSNHEICKFFVGHLLSRVLILIHRSKWIRIRATKMYNWNLIFILKKCQKDK